MMNIIVPIFCALSILAAPADNYFSWFSPDIVKAVCNHISHNEYCPHLDYNGDGVLSISDAVSISRRYQENCLFGNEITIDEETINSIIAENYSTPCIYWEFDMVDNKVCRQYSVTTNKITVANIYLEFEDFTTDSITIEIDPFEEIARVIS